MISRAENPEVSDPLWAEYRRTGSVRHRDALVERHLPLVRGVLLKLKTLPWHVDRNEIESQLNMAVVHCVEKYDPKKGVAFSTFMYGRMKGAVLDAIRSEDQLSTRCRRKREKKINDVAILMMHHLGRMPRAEEVSEQTGMTEEEIREAMPVSIVSLESLEVDGGFKSVKFKDALVSRKGWGGRNVPSFRFAELTNGVGLEAKLILWAYFGMDHTMREISDFFGCSESRISLIIQRTCKDIRERIEGDT